ncbi:MAG: CapA family protein [Oligoflexia bacterium]|nr:CapA family protein [Oligoflexia bacterium]
MLDKTAMDDRLTFFLCGDVMTGRGIDQILRRPSKPELHEEFVKDAQGYVELAEQANGPIPRSALPSYVWGDALEELEKAKPAARIINLETSVTTSESWERKGINYRMHPRNIEVLQAARIDACALANNHVLDWGRAGLIETLECLGAYGVKFAGAGRTLAEAEAPAMIGIPNETGRILLFSMGLWTSGIPSDWAATSRHPGVDFLGDLSMASVHKIRARVLALKEPQDIVIFSVHWGDNWGYDIPSEQKDFAHALIDEAAVDVLHGHSSHHAKGIEVYREKLVLYGCGDFLNDYEGIRGYENFRDDLVLMYFPQVQAGSGKLLSLRMVPMQLSRFRLNRASQRDARWLCGILNREGEGLGTRFRLEGDGSLNLARTEGCKI